VTHLLLSVAVGVCQLLLLCGWACTYTKDIEPPQTATFLYTV